MLVGRLDDGLVELEVWYVSVARPEQDGEECGERGVRCREKGKDQGGHSPASPTSLEVRTLIEWSGFTLPMICAEFPLTRCASYKPVSGAQRQTTERDVPGRERA